MPAIDRASGCVTAVANTSSPQVFDGQVWTADRFQQSLDGCRAEEKRTGRVEQMPGRIVQPPTREGERPREPIPLGKANEIRAREDARPPNKLRTLLWQHVRWWTPRRMTIGSRSLKRTSADTRKPRSPSCALCRWGARPEGFPPSQLARTPGADTVVVRWHYGGTTVALPCSGVKLLRLRHLWCNGCL